MTVRQLFVIPELSGRPTGGTLYNRHLLAALAQLGASVRVSDADGARSAIQAHEFDLVWLDSLYLQLAPKLCEGLEKRGRLGLLLHYLPALVAFGADLNPAQLSRPERDALEVADCAWVTSAFMRETLLRLGFAERPLLCIEPGCELARGMPPSPENGVRAVLVAHVLTEKGIEPLLEALARLLEPGDRFDLRIVGDSQAEPEYAARCRALVAGEAALAERVTFSGVLSEAGVLAELAASNLLLSASVMESYGMALAEGRRVGLPLLACDGGNVRAHVQAQAGGELVANAKELARACVRLCRHPVEHARRLVTAESRIPALRTWGRAASELLSALQVPGVLPENRG